MTLRQSTMRILGFFLLVSRGLAVRSEVRLPKILSDHMVIQRGVPPHVWGWSGPAEQITVTFHTQHVTARSNDLGQWSVYLAPEAAGGPFDLVVSEKNTVTVSDVLVGDVWVAAGQSNMEMPLRGIATAQVKDGAEAIRSAVQPQIRLLRLSTRASAYPLNDIDATWTRCTPESAAPFSAVAYFFGREIQQSSGVPIGLIDSTWGGSFADAWVSLDALTSESSLLPILATYSRHMDDQTDLPLVLAKEKRDDEAARAANKVLPEPQWHPSPESWTPGAIYNGMIAPLTPLPIEGVIWYQGESNGLAARAPMYFSLFSALISDWRSKWRQGNFPFLFVQISVFDSTPGVNLGTEDWDWGRVRDAQRRTLGLANTAMAVTLDIGDPHNVHPPDKKTVGHRLALAARAVAYREPIEYSGPLYRTAAPVGTELCISFDHGEGLNTKGGTVAGLEIAGADHKFYPAAARLRQNQVFAASEKVQSPRYARYAWANAPEANLYNSAGLPASTFTTEQ